MMYDTTTGIIICVLTNQLPAPAFQTSVQLLSTIINNPVGINEAEIENQSFEVYPNPTSDLITINDPLGIIEEVQIIHPNGKMVMSSKVPVFSIAALPDGIYFLIVNTANGVTVQKVVKSQP
jgi:hypothetical protein